jgi:hypothetical protein
MRYRTKLLTDGSAIEALTPSDDGNDWIQVGTVNTALDRVAINEQFLFVRIDIAAGIATNVEVFLLGEDGQ